MWLEALRQIWHWSDDTPSLRVRRKLRKRYAEIIRAIKSKPAILPRYLRFALALHELNLLHLLILYAYLKETGYSEYTLTELERAFSIPKEQLVDDLMLLSELADDLDIEIGIGVVKVNADLLSEDEDAVEGRR